MAKLMKFKAAQILHEGHTHGRPLTTKQQAFFGAVASGKKPKKKK